MIHQQWTSFLLLFAAALVTYTVSIRRGLQPARDAHGNLVIYTFADIDSESATNLNYFVAEAVRRDNSSHFIILLQDNKTSLSFKLPTLPDNAQYVVHEETACRGWGTISWFLLNHYQVIRNFRYFIFVDSSVRGPFLPAYAKGIYQWTDAFTERLTGSVKLVGSAISCVDVPLRGDPKALWRRNPHVLTSAMATDQVGLQLLLSAPKVVECHPSAWDMLFHSELGASAAVLAAGFNLDSLMHRYQGVDWRDPSTWDCNARLSPIVGQQYDGLSLDPLEVLFVRLRTPLLLHHAPSAHKAHKYYSWQQVGAGNASGLATSSYLQDLNRIKAPKILLAREMGSECFDADYYAKMNMDLVGVLPDVNAAYSHFANHGQFEARPYRYSCTPDYNKIIYRFQNM